MSRCSMVRAAIAAASFSGVCVGAHAADEFTIDSDALQSGGCFGQAACSLDEAEIATTGGVLANKVLSGAAGFGVSGGPSGSEIDIGQNLRVDFDQSRSIIAIKILFLFNGPEFSDRAEKAQVSADGTAYTLSVRNDADDASADWSGPGTVTQCGATTAAGTGCFLITDPFPGAVSRLDFTAVAGSPPFSGAGSNESDYSIEFIDTADVVVGLDNCATPTGCPVAASNGQVAASFNSMETTGGSDETPVIQVQFPDCRYIPQDCVNNLLPPASDYAATDKAAYEILIGLGVIKPLVPKGPNRYRPAGQLLNVKPLLPPEVTSLFDSSGVPPNGLPALYINPRWRAQEGNDFLFDGLFFKTDPAVVFSDTFEGLIDVSVLTGSELGCFPSLGDLFAWDVISAASELARSVDGRFIDMMINVGCVNPTKVSGTRLSLYVVNSEVVRDTLGPTITSASAKLTENNDAVFARLAQSQWMDLGAVKASYACKQADPVPAGGLAPLPSALCKNLASLWSTAKDKIRICINETFQPASSLQVLKCDRARESIDDFEEALPAAASGPDPFNRLGELKARVEVVQHVWDTRFLNSLKPGGFCREKGTCPP